MELFTSYIRGGWSEKCILVVVEEIILNLGLFYVVGCRDLKHKLLELSRAR
jgi:hypothetical protein